MSDNTTETTDPEAPAKSAKKDDHVEHLLAVQPDHPVDDDGNPVAEDGEPLTVAGLIHAYTDSTGSTGPATFDDEPEDSGVLNPRGFVGTSNKTDEDRHAATAAGAAAAAKQAREDG